MAGRFFAALRLAGRLRFAAIKEAAMRFLRLPAFFFGAFRFLAALRFAGLLRFAAIKEAALRFLRLPAFFFGAFRFLAVLRFAGLLRFAAIAEARLVERRPRRATRFFAAVERRADDLRLEVVLRAFEEVFLRFAIWRTPYHRSLFERRSNAARLSLSGPNIRRMESKIINKKL
ncbi:MAG: hypothetical protein WAN51_05655 [Alphaproteobacteria bacterium]